MHGLWTNDPTRRGRRRRPWRTAARRRDHDGSPAPRHSAAGGTRTGAPDPDPGGADGGPVSAPGSGASAAADGGLRRRARAWSRSSSSPWSAAGYAVGAALGWGSPRSRPDHGRLRAQRRGGHSPPSPASSTPARRRAASGPPGCCSRSPRPWPPLGNAGLGLVRGRPRTGRCPAPLADLFFLLLRAARHRGSAGPRQAPGDQGGLGLPRPRRLADRRLAAHPLLEPRARPARPSSAGPSVAHAALSLAYPLLDIALVSMVLALHFRRSAVNRSAVNTADRARSP